ncbi:MAG TPA: hypothetical protein VF621_10355 [Pyrinomonadaceae bacterium]
MVLGRRPHGLVRLADAARPGLLGRGLHRLDRERSWDNLRRAEWSVHYNSSPDGKLFAGDGGGPNSVAAHGNGQWIYLFRPEMVNDRTGGQLEKATQSRK